MSSTTTTTPTPNLFPSGQHLSSHLLKTLQNAQRVSAKVLSKKALFTDKAEFRAALKDPLHIKRDDLESVVWNFQSLYESLSKSMKTPWGLIRDISTRYYFPVINAWVTDGDNDDFRRCAMRNVIAHRFNTGNVYRELDGELPDRDEEEKMFQETFSATKFWDLLEVEMGPLVKELEYAIGVFGEQVPAMPKEVRKVKEIVVEDMSAPIPEEWGQGDSVGWCSSESPGVEWAPGVDVAWDSGIEEDCELEVADLVLVFQQLNIVEEET
jgi:hypothetical protein